MAEKIDERKMQETTNGAFFLTLPRVYVEDVGLKKGDCVDIFRDGDVLILSPKREARVVG